MESPFNRGYYNLSQPRRYYRGPPPPARPTRVVSIPVHFVGSEAPSAIPMARAEATPAIRHAAALEEEASRSVAALRIQKAARGFLVRKAVSAVRKMEAEVAQVERRMEEARDLVCREERERIRLNETLMGVLFRLDSVRGVRDYRKKVVRRAISLQEALDSAAYSGGIISSEVKEHESSKEISMETPEAATETPESSVTDNCGREGLELGRPSDVEENTAEDQILVNPPGVIEDPAAEVTDVEIAVAEEQILEPESEEGDLAAEFTGVESGLAEEELISESEEKIQLLAPSIAEEQEGTEETTKEATEAAAPSSKESGRQSLPSSVSGNDGRLLGSEEKSMKEVMDRMVLESERLRGLVAELMETNAAQCRMIYGLSQRVETLERKVGQLGRKNKKARKCCDMKY